MVEYGDFDDSWNVAMPYYANFNQDVSLMFSTPSVPQRGLGNRTFNLPLGATVGGGTTVNGMAAIRGSRHDYDSWEEIGNPGWGWKEVLRYFRKVRGLLLGPGWDLANTDKSSTLNAPSPEVTKKLGYTFSRDGYGHGPFQATFPPWQWPGVCKFLRAIPSVRIDVDQLLDPMNKAWTEDLGFPFRNDGGTDGDVFGVAWRPQSSDSKKLTRSSARTAYYNPVQNRPNLQLLLMSYVGKVQVHKGVARGVEVYSRSNSSAKVSITAKKEVILAAGAIHTTQILQLSGIGPRELLESLNIPVVEDLPGVGANFQDHPTIRGATFKCECQVPGRPFPNPC